MLHAGERLGQGRRREQAQGARQPGCPVAAAAPGQRQQQHRHHGPAAPTSHPVTVAITPLTTNGRILGECSGRWRGSGELVAPRLRPGARTIVGIAGPPGAGKSTLAAARACPTTARLGPGCVDGRAVGVPMDGFHLSNVELERLGLADRKGAPETFDADGFVHLLRRIRARDADAGLRPGLQPQAARVDRRRDPGRPGRGAGRGRGELPPAARAAVGPGAGTVGPRRVPGCPGEGRASPGLVRRQRARGLDAGRRRGLGAPQRRGQRPAGGGHPPARRRGPGRPNATGRPSAVQAKCSSRPSAIPYGGPPQEPADHQQHQGSRAGPETKPSTVYPRPAAAAAIAVARTAPALTSTSASHADRQRFQTGAPMRPAGCSGAPSRPTAAAARPRGRADRGKGSGARRPADAADQLGRAPECRQPLMTHLGSVTPQRPSLPRSVFTEPTIRDPGGSPYRPCLFTIRSSVAGDLATSAPSFGLSQT